MVTNFLAGTMYATVDGQSYAVMGEGNYTVSADTRETLKGQSGIHGVSSVAAAGRMTWKGRDSSAVSISALNAAIDATVVFELINGKTIVGRNMWRTGDPIEVATEDASFTVAFEGVDVSEQ